MGFTGSESRVKLSQQYAFVYSEPMRFQHECAMWCVWYVLNKYIHKTMLVLYINKMSPESRTQKNKLQCFYLPSLNWIHLILVHTFILSFRILFPPIICLELNLCTCRSRRWNQNTFLFSSSQTHVAANSLKVLRTIVEQTPRQTQCTIQIAIRDCAARSTTKCIIKLEFTFHTRKKGEKR